MLPSGAANIDATEQFSSIEVRPLAAPLRQSKLLESIQWRLVHRFHCDPRWLNLAAVHRYPSGHVNLRKPFAWGQ